MADTKPRAAPPPSSQESFDLAMQEVGVDLQKGDYAHAREVLERARRSPYFSTAPAVIQHAVVLLIAGIATDAKDWPAARAAIVEATSMAEASEEDWILRFRIGATSGDKTEAVSAMTTLATRYPQTTATYPDATILYWMAEAGRPPDGEARAFALSDALFANWKPQDPFEDLSSQRAEYVLGLLARNRRADAEAAARLITKDEILIGMRADKRFDRVDEGAVARLAPKVGSLARLKAVEALLPANGDRISGPTAKAEALMDLGRFSEALIVIDAALAKANSAPDAFVDLEERLAWAHNVRNQILANLGRREESIEALEAGARTPEHGKSNVSQTLNLAVAQMTAGRSKAALATVASVRLDRMSAYGRSVALKTEACAAADLGDAATAQTALKALRDLGDEAKGNTLDALLCVNDLDAAAAIVIERLKSPGLRRVTLVMLQDLPSSPHATAHNAAQGERVATLRKRPDVIAAVEPVGRILRYRTEDLWQAP
ncbi:hypothetical protein [Caulobacter sp.]|uniref:hypothetical protein n=1 Tax=Caulobacter sp. TaxID=78 RepID=UPI002B45CAD5|nr:hypothetical protein [Caulobacter sp.]